MIMIGLQEVSRLLLHCRWAQKRTGVANAGNRFHSDENTSGPDLLLFTHELSDYVVTSIPDGTEESTTKYRKV